MLILILLEDVHSLEFKWDFAESDTTITSYKFIITWEEERLNQLLLIAKFLQCATGLTIALVDICYNK